MFASRIFSSVKGVIPRFQVQSISNFSSGRLCSNTALKMSPIPIIVIGRNPRIAIKVREGVMPEYDGMSASLLSSLHYTSPYTLSVVHIITTVEQGLNDLPLLLSNPSQTPMNVDNNLGSKNHGSRPLAVAAGGGFNDEMFNKMKDACKDVEQGIVWVRVYAHATVKMLMSICS
jgi:hypothetical protein